MSKPVVVVAEDDDSVRTLLRLELERRGYVVHACDNGRAALELIHAHGPDAAVVDHTMPVMGGNEVLAAVRGDPSTAHLAVVILTARTDVASINESFDRGADDYLTKPFHADELERSLRTLLEGR